MVARKTRSNGRMSANSTRLWPRDRVRRRRRAKKANRFIWVTDVGLALSASRMLGAVTYTLP